MSAEPKLTPVTWGCVTGVVAPCEMKTVPGEMVTFDVSLLLRVMVTPPTGAPVTSDTGNGTDWLGPTVMPLCKTMEPNKLTLTFSEPLLNPAEFATIVVFPTATPVTVKLPVAPAAGALSDELPAVLDWPRSARVLAARPTEVVSGMLTLTLPAGMEMLGG